MPTYALFLRDEKGNTDRMAPDEFTAHFEKFVAWAEQLKGEGRLRAVQRLADREGRTVRRRGGALVVDGPYVEGKEAVLGFFVIEAADDREAWRIAGQCPAVDSGGSVEIRLVGEFPQPA